MPTFSEKPSTPQTRTFARLFPFMRDEPRSLGATAQWLRCHRAQFDRDSHYRYAIFNRPQTCLLGEVMLLDRCGPDARELGYWLARDHLGKGFAREAAALTLRVAFELHKLARVELLCAPENHASTKLARKLGFCHEATLRRRTVDTDGVAHDLMVWTLFDRDYASSPARTYDARAWNCLDQPIELPDP